VPRLHDITATGGLASAVYTMGVVLFIIAFALVESARTASVTALCSSITSPLRAGNTNELEFERGIRAQLKEAFVPGPELAQV
jgi:hypothetical protein